jgi:hypothetical protein
MDWDEPVTIRETSGSPFLLQLCPLVLFIVSLWLFFLVYKCWTVSNSVRVSALFPSFCAHPCWDASQATKEDFGQRKTLFSEFKRRLYDVSFALTLVKANINLKKFPKLRALWNIIVLFLRTTDKSGRTLCFPLKSVEYEVLDVVTFCVCVWKSSLVSEPARYRNFLDVMKG